MKTLVAALSLIILNSIAFCLSPVLVITHAYNRPDFIKMQYTTFKKNLQDDYKFVVFNDGRTKQMEERIRQTCKELNIPCIRISQEVHDRPYLKRELNSNYNNPAPRCANVVQYSLDQIGFKYNGIVAVIDSDMFLIKPFSIREYLNNHDLAMVKQVRTNGTNQVEYMWNGIFFMDMRTLPDKQTINFNCSVVNGVLTDVGGETHNYLKNHPNIKIRQIQHFSSVNCTRAECQNHHTSPCRLETSSLKQQKFSLAEISLLQTPGVNSEFYINNSFVHYRSGGNWDNRPPREIIMKSRALRRYIKATL